MLKAGRRGADGRRMRQRLARLTTLTALVAVCCLTLPGVASALDFKIVNQSGRDASEVWVTVSAAGEFDVPGMADNVPRQLSEIPGEELTIEKLVSGRIYIAYGSGVTEATTFASPTRFDWAELTVTPSSFDVANLTAVDQFGIGMRLDTFDSSDQHLEAVASANSNTVFAALQNIPGGPQATLRGADGEIVRVLSPNKTSVYPSLAPYVQSMAGKTISLHTAFFGSPFTTSTYSGTFAADGSIQLHGTTNPIAKAAPVLNFSGPQLIEDIYTGGNTPNNLEGAIYRDLLAGFSAGFWDGKYGNDALDFCTEPVTTGQGTWCPNGFDQPGFGEAKTGLQPFATCEQYAAVINQYSDAYGNPYSDAAKKVTVSLDQPGSGGDVDTLQLTIQPDTGNAMPVTGGNPNCGARPAPVPAPTKKTTVVKARFLAKAKLKGRTAKIARLTCSAPCGKIRVVAKTGNKVVARNKSSMPRTSGPVKLRLTGKGRKAMAKKNSLKVMVTVWVTPPGEPATRSRHSLKLVR